MSVTGIIFASDNEVKLNELTIHRTTASLPFGGRYRLIDFALSNFVNSDITRIGIIAKNNYSSLMDHIRMGRDWDLNRKNSGIAVFPPFVVGNAKEVYKGKIEALYCVLDFIKSGRDDYVIIANGNVAANIDLSEVIKVFEQKNADIMIVSHRAVPTTSRRLELETDSNGKVTNILIKENFDANERLVSLNMYLIHKELLISLIETATARSLVDFERDLLQKKLDKLNIYSYELMGYAAMIEDIKSYYNESMKLLDPRVREELFYAHGKIYTKVKDSPPCKYLNGAIIKNSLIADGCVIDGQVENSILFRGVVVKSGAVIKNSIIMQGAIIGEGANLSYVIADKHANIAKGRLLAGYETYPIIIDKNKIV